MNYNTLMNYLALESNSTDSKFDIMNGMMSVLRTQNSDLELSLYMNDFVDKLNKKITLNENHLTFAFAAGATSCTPFEFKFDEKDYSRDIFQCIEMWKYAVNFLKEWKNNPKQTKLTLDMDTLPDYLKPEELGELMGWTISTISTKHSKGELACVEGTRLTPKKGLQEYLNKKTKGLMDNSEKWFEENILKNKTKKKPNY